MEIEIPDLNDIAFDEQCRACYGSGLRVERQYVPPTDGKKRGKYVDVRVPCNCANGRVLTPAGRTLLAFLEREGFNRKEANMKVHLIVMEVQDSGHEVFYATLDESRIPELIERATKEEQARLNGGWSKPDLYPIFSETVELV